MLSRLHSKMTYANVVATLALFLSLSGAAYAGTKIGSADIKNHSIQQTDLADASVGSPQVIDHSLRLNDLAGSVKTAFAKTVYQTHVNYQLTSSPPVIAPSPSSTRVASLAVPNSNYLLTAVVHVQGSLTDNGNGGTPPTEVECTLGAAGAGPSAQVTAREDFRGEYLDDHQLAMTLATPVTTGKVVIDCDRTLSGTITDTQVLEVSLQALRVDTIA